MSASSIGPADHPNQRRAARNVSRASCSPGEEPELDARGGADLGGDVVAVGGVAQRGRRVRD
jgi:hypothetical protein